MVTIIGEGYDILILFKRRQLMKIRIVILSIIIVVMTAAIFADELVLARDVNLHQLIKPGDSGPSFSLCSL